MIAVQQEFLATCWHEAQPLLVAHWTEAIGEGSPDPDLALLQVLEQANALRLFTMRDDGALVGYAIFVVTVSTHQAGRTVALCDGVYIDPAYRSYRAVRRLWCFAEACLREDGAREIRAHSAVSSSLGSLLRRFGYNPTEIVHTKVF